MSIATRAQRAMSFGTVAEDYDRLRPPPAGAAVDWLLPERRDGRPLTYSRVITASEQDRDTFFAEVRAALAERFPGATEIDVPLHSACWRADRARR